MFSGRRRARLSILKKKNREIRTKSRWYGSTPPSCAKDLTISEGTGVTSLFHSRVLMRFHAPLRPRKMDKFLFLGTHTRFVTTKRIMGTLPLTTSFMNFIVIEIHVLPRQNLELATLLPSRQRFTSVERMIHSDRHESPTTLHCQNPCCIFERGWSPCFSHVTILVPLSPPLSSVHRDKM